MTYNESTSAALSTTASVAPLLGLFGTVWGLVHAFMNIAATQSADITAVAPGIAEALITTIAGLLVAIPALVMYNVTVQIHTRLRERVYTLVDTVLLFLHKNG
jgi:biopolymer transport protein ExbB